MIYIHPEEVESKKYQESHGRFFETWWGCKA